MRASPLVVPGTVAGAGTGGQGREDFRLTGQLWRSDDRMLASAITPDLTHHSFGLSVRSRRAGKCLASQEDEKWTGFKRFSTYRSAIMYSISVSWHHVESHHTETAVPQNIIYSPSSTVYGGKVQCRIMMRETPIIPGSIESALFA